MTSKIEQRCAEVEKLMQDNLIRSDVRQHDLLPVVVVEIIWGDWKHSHARADALVKNMGGILLGETVTAEDGSDTYSAEHYYGFSDLLGEITVEG